MTIRFRSIVRTAACAALLIALGGCAQGPKQQAETRKGYAFWPAPPDPPRIQFLVAFNSSDDLKPPKQGLDALIYGAETEQSLGVVKPYGVDMWDGRIYVCDIRSAGVIVLDLKKRQTRVMGATGSGTVHKAVDVAVAPDGTKYVADQGRGAVAVFNADERFVRFFNLGDASPVSLAVSGDLLYVADFKAQHVKVLDRYSGEALRTIGKPSAGDGGFVRPLSVAVDPEGNVLVSDVIRCRIQKFSPDGRLLAAFGEAGNRPGQFARPKHLDVGADGILYVADAAFNNVQLLDEKGLPMMYFGAPGTHLGAMDLPAGLEVHEGDIELFERYIHPAFQAERLIIVTNQFGPQRIAVYAMGQLRPGKTLADIAPDRIDVASGIEPPKGASRATTRPTNAPATPPADGR